MSDQHESAFDAAQQELEKDTRGERRLIAYFVVALAVVAVLVVLHQVFYE
jgi:hypothetical protein